MSKMINYGRSFLLWYAHDLINFRLQELHAITTCCNIKFEWLEEPSINDPYLIINCSTTDVMKIMSRTVLIRILQDATHTNKKLIDRFRSLEFIRTKLSVPGSAYELWAKSKTLSDLHAQLKNVPKSFTDPYCGTDSSFRIMIESFGKKIKDKNYKVQRIDELEFLSFEGPIKLNDPDHSFLLMEYYGTDRNHAPELPFRLFFGRWVADGQRGVSQKINLKDRKFIGNTSMDPLLSLVMGNMACIKSGDVVLDPFVGTGGLLIAAAHYGAYVLGTDIDYLMLHGKAKPSRLNQKQRDPDESILANMKQYGLESHYLDVLVSDAALPLWRCHSFFDAIITDPPYGIRESTERIGTEKECKIPDHLAPGHIPSKVSYNLQDMIEDLLDFSSLYLKLHGRLVYWMPVFNEDFDKKTLPYHSCLELISCCKQPLTGHSSRYLITMEKVKENVNAAEKGQVSNAALSFRKRYFETHRKKIYSQ